MEREIKPKINEFVRLGATTGISVGLQNTIFQVVAIDGDFCLIESPKLRCLQHEIKISEWTFFEVPPEYLQAYCPDDVWADEII